MNKAIAGLILCACFGSAMGQNLRMPIPYTDGMVLQRNKPLTIRGQAAPGDTVTVELDGLTATGIANSRGQWSATLPAMQAAQDLVMTVTDGTITLTYTDVAVGEVWVASGQSNMAFTLKQALTGADDIPASTDPELRFFDMKPQYFCYGTPMPEWFCDSINALSYYRPTSWHKSSPETSPEMSAVAYYFGKALRDSLNVPIGLIHNAIGGCPCEAWIDSASLAQGLPEMAADPRHNPLAMPWVQQRMVENVGNEPTQHHPYEPSYLFNTGILPLGQYPVAGAIWYQGESNEHNPGLYERMFPWLVQSWRNYWEEPELPFIYTQLSSIAPRSTWPEFRNVQRRLLDKVPFAGMAICSDLGDSLDVHPRAKQPVGLRLSRWALHDVYGHSGVVSSGPLVKSAYLQDGEVIVNFQWGHGMTASDGGEIATFELAAADSVFYPANATVISDNKIRVTNMQVSNPKYVRYGWQPFSHGNLVNSDSLPASTFLLEIPESEPGIENGVSASYGGCIGNIAIFAGGCNFPEDPLGKNSQKRFYQGIYAKDLSNPDNQWHRIGSLPAPMAYGASAQTDQGLVLIGGCDSTNSLASTWLLTLNADKAALTPLPDLPAPIDNMSAVAIGSKIYVAGGNFAGQPSNSLLCLDLDTLNAGWYSLPPFPGNPRVQPVMASGFGADKDCNLYLFGGFAGKGSNREATLDTDGFCYSPTLQKWTALLGPLDLEGNPLSVGGGAACSIKANNSDLNGKILVTGGVNAKIFLKALQNQAPDYLYHPIEWYCFNPNLLVFDPATTEWSVLGTDPAYARAGALLISAPSEVLLIGGELKPRIRTPHISKLRF
ncbi:MAG: cyclically-permuted mutarotase family protein [Bacteroidales bacterium]|nr:cyclically-permuted mutarotase family protein [Bacteroidales bacterium]